MRKSVIKAKLGRGEPVLLTQLHLIETVGLQNYLTEQMGKADEEPEEG